MNALAEKFYSQQFFETHDFIAANFGILDPAATTTRILVDLKDCSARTETGFRKWVRAYARRAADEKQREQVSLEAVIERARCESASKPFVHEKHPSNSEVTFVQILHGRKSYPWIVPTGKLPLVQVLHPTVEVKFSRIGNRRIPFLIKRCQRQRYSGTWENVDVDLAEIWINAQRDETIVAHDGNYLNFLDGNLEATRPEICAANQVDNPDAPPSWQPSLRDESDTNDWVPAKSTRVPDKEREQMQYAKIPPFNRHEVKVFAWLHGKDDEPEEVRELRKAWRVDERKHRT